MKLKFNIKDYVRQFGFCRDENKENTSVPPEQAKFVSLLKLSINQKFAEILEAKNTAMSDAKPSGEIKRGKENDPAMITLLDAKIITNYVRSVFVKRLGLVPGPLEAALTLSEATVAPSTVERIKMFRRAIGLTGGLGGLGAIAMAIMVGLGVGTTATVGTIWASIVAWASTTVGSATIPFFWPITIGLGGAGVAAFAVYFSASGSSAERAEKFITALLNSTEKAVDSVWCEYGDKLA